MKQLKGLLITLICILPCAVFAQFQGTYSGFVGDIINLNPSTVANQIFSIDWKAMSGSVDCVNVRTYGGSTVGATVEINKYFTGTVRIRASYKTVSNTTKTEYFDIECNAVTLTPNPSNLNMKVGETEDITFSISPSGKSPTVDYSSSNTSVATVGYLGRVTAIAKGYATITLSNNMGPNATVNVSVDGGSGGGGTGGGSDISDEGYYYDNTEEGHQMLFYKTYYYGDCAKVIKTPDDGACISSTTPGKVTVPNVAKDYPVRIIGNWAFSNLPHITDIVLPQSTTVIENYCVYNCTDLQTITCLSENPPSCYSTSFHGCEKMTLYVKSKSAKEKYAAAEGWKWFKTIKVIGEEDDIQVTGITLNTYSVTLPIGDTKQLSATISPSNATNKSVTWSTSNSSVATVSSSGLVTAKSTGNATIACKANDGSGVSTTCSVTVEPGDGHVFKDKTSEGIEMTFKVISAKDKTCQVGTDDYDVTWMSGSSITKSTTGVVTIPSTVNGYKVVGIGGNAFYECTNIDRVIIPTSATYIGNTAFAYTSIENIDIPNSVTWIGDAFYRNKQLRSITIHKNLEFLSYAALNGCDALSSIIVEDGNKVYDSRDNCNAIIETATNKLMIGCKNTTFPLTVNAIGKFSFCDYHSIQNIIIPNTITTIEKCAFTDSWLESVIIPASVETIEERAFSGCKKLTSITLLQKNPIEIKDNVFGKTLIDIDYESGIYANAVLYVPSGTKEKYQSTAGWKNFKNIIEIDPSGIKGIRTESVKSNSIYNLSGQRLTAPQKGINIIGGKKFVVK